ncbi:MAG TPA: glycosyltransferase family 87 protein [Bryobacteraceae bacterium]|nr:glycosyltransferase family 87 protein [Bryobacteraceae bacterium]
MLVEKDLTQNIPFREALHRRKTSAAIAVAFLGLLGLGFNIWFAVLNRAGWGIDFSQFYAASRLAGTGHLYDWDALLKAERGSGFEVPTGRLPVVLYGHRVLSSLPYTEAQYVWLAGSLAALIVFALIWPGTQRLPMMLALAWSMPITLVLLYGQDVPFWLMFFAAGLLLMEKKRPWIAGIAFSLCICKFHLALGIPVLLVAQKRWKTLIGGAMAFSALIAACYAIEGPGWLLAYMKMSQLPQFSPAAARMPNLHGLASWLPWPTTAEIAGVVAIILLLWAACRGGLDLGTAGAATAACGLLLGHHSYAGDCALLIPLAVLTIQRHALPHWLKVWAVLLLSPVPVLLLVSRRSFFGQALIAGFVVAAIVFAKAKPSLADQQEHGHVPGH